MSTNAISQPPEMLGIGTRAYALASLQVLAFTGTTDATPDPVGSVEVCLYATEDCFVSWGAAPEATAASFPIPAGAQFHMRVEPTDKFAALQASAGRDLYVIPVA